MRTFYGEVTEIHDMGVVAETCPHCDQLRSCLLRTVHQGYNIFFFKTADVLRESSCLCTECHKPFPGKPSWNYPEVASIREARGMSLDDLLAKTNPILADRIHFKEQIGKLGGDERFAIAYDKVEGMRPGRIRSDLFQSLLNWTELDEKQREELVTKIGLLSQAWHFARHMAVSFPTSSGSLAFFLSAPLFGAIVIAMVVTRKWIWGVLAFGASAVATTILESYLFKRSVSTWTRQKLIPEAQEAGIPLERFIAVIDDIPGSKLGMLEELWPIKNQLPNIRDTLAKQGKLATARPIGSASV